MSLETQNRIKADPTTSKNNLTISVEKLAELEQLLVQQTDTYQSVAEVMHKKKLLLIEGQYHNLGDIDQHLVSLGQKSIQLEQTRLNLMSDLGCADKNLEGLVQLVRQQKVTYPTQPLVEARQKLRHVVVQVQELNDNNRKLIDLSIKWIESTMSLITNTVAPEGASYGADGQKLKAKGKNNPMVTNPIQTQSSIVLDI